MTMTAHSTSTHNRPVGPGTPNMPAQASAVNDWVAAAPFSAWVRQLTSDTGLPWRVIARAAAVPSVTVLGLLRGRDGQLVRQLRRVDAERLLHLDHRALAVLGGEPASCQSLRILAWSLGLRGCRPEHVAGFIGVATSDVRSLMAGGAIWCSRLQHLRAEAACEAWGIDPAEVLRVEAIAGLRNAS